MMPEYIERGAANEALRECVRVYPTSFYNGIEVARTAIHKLPAAADVVEVVRCKDCVWYVKSEGVCTLVSFRGEPGVPIQCYCNHGVRKRKEDEE